MGHTGDFGTENNNRTKNSHFPVNNLAAKERLECLLKCTSMTEDHQVLALRAVFTEEGCIRTLELRSEEVEYR